VFRGGFTRDAAEQVASAKLMELAGLTDKSLLMLDSTGRYQLHELLRQYAREQLANAGDVQAAHESHAIYYADFMTRRWTQMKGTHQKQALVQMDAELENSRAAWKYWLERKDVKRLKQFFGAFWVFYDIHAWYPAGIALFEQGIHVMQTVSTTEAEAGAGWMLAAQGFYKVVGESLSKQGFELAQQGVRILEQLEQWDEMVVPLMSLFLAASQVSLPDIALQAAHDCLRVAAAVGDEWGVARSKQMLAIRAIDSGAYNDARELAREALAIYEAHGDQWSESVLCIEVLALLAITLRHFDEAHMWIERGRAAAETIEFTYAVQMAYWQSGFIAALQNDYGKAGTCWQKALTVGEHIVGAKVAIGFSGSLKGGIWGGRRLMPD